MNRARVRVLAFVVLAQLLVLVGMTAFQGARVAAGTRVVLEVVPVDPLDLARGAYVDLRYEGLDDLDLPDGAEDGDTVWIRLDPPRGGDRAWQPTRIVDDVDQLEEGDVFVEGTVLDDTAQLPRVQTYYASADEAQRLEAELGDGGFATVSLDDDGTPTLVDVAG